ncbi:hypothetical protein [Tardiphaga sp. P9-11]|nr:hypothetical protein [Tardiphaga sp. P9-11]
MPFDDGPRKAPGSVKNQHTHSFLGKDRPGGGWISPPGRFTELGAE